MPFKIFRIRNKDNLKNDMKEIDVQEITATRIRQFSKTMRATIFYHSTLPIKSKEPKTPSHRLILTTRITREFHSLETTTETDL